MTRSLDSDLLRSFLAVAEAGSITAAADRLLRTQSAVSMQIRKLEDQVGAALLERHPRGVIPTPRGRQLLPYARRVLDLLDEAGAALSAPPLAGPVRVGVSGEYSESLLPRILAAFAERHPEAEVFTRSDKSDNLLKGLEAGELDLAVIFRWEPVPGEEVLGIDPTVWTCSEMHDLHLRDPLPVAAYRESGWCRDFALRSLDQQGLRWRIVFECENAASMRSAVRAGLALGAFSRSAIPQGCRELGAQDGFPLVDSSRVVLKRNPRGASDAVRGMEATLREAFAPLARHSAQAAAQSVG